MFNYSAKSDEELLVEARGKECEGLESTIERKKRKMEERTEEVRGKGLHGQFFRQTDDVASDKTWLWLLQGHMKKETEGLLMAAENQSLRTNAVKAKIDRSQNDSLCRMCRQKEETVSHLLCECPKLAQKEYKQRHDGVAKALHWDLCKQCGIGTCDKWYEHSPDSVEENENYKLLWDFPIQTDRKLDHNRPDIDCG